MIDTLVTLVTPSDTYIHNNTNNTNNYTNNTLYLLYPVSSVSSVTLINTNPKEFLAAHENCKFDICFGKNRTKWSESSYTKQQYDPRINLCQLNHDELILEGDSDALINILNLVLIKDWLVKHGNYFMVTSHKGKSPYCWLKLTTNDNRKITEAERKAVIKFFSLFAPLDEALAYLNFVRPIPNTLHWKHNKNEEVIEVNEGKALNIDELGIEFKNASQSLQSKNKLNEYNRDAAQGLAKKIQLSKLFDTYGYEACPLCEADRFYVHFNDNKGYLKCNKCSNSLGIKKLIEKHLNGRMS